MSIVPRKGIQFVLACSFSTLLITSSAFADDVVLDEITIFGETVERSAQDTSTSVTVITGEELDKSPETNL